MNKPSEDLESISIKDLPVSSTKFDKACLKFIQDLIEEYGGTSEKLQSFVALFNKFYEKHKDQL